MKGHKRSAYAAPMVQHIPRNTLVFHVLLSLLAGFGFGIFLMIVAKTVITLELEATTIHPATSHDMHAVKGIHASNVLSDLGHIAEHAGVAHEAKLGTVGHGGVAGKVSAHGVNPKPQSAVKLASGSLHSETARQLAATPWPKAGDTVHVLFTSNGSPYLNFQSRIMYGTFKNAQKMPGGEKMVAMTRILHRTTDDELMDEIPTFRAQPLQPNCDRWCEFPVSDRADAVRQFFEAAHKDPSLIKAPWLLLIEGDYVWAKPINAPLAESDAPSWGFFFGYINPEWTGLKQVIRKMFPESEGTVSKIPHSGPAPVLMRHYELEKVTPDWMRLTAHIEADKDSKRLLGWVREMYAFSIAIPLNKIPFTVLEPPRTPLISQPPADHKLGNAAMFHYTWGAIFKDKKTGKKIWEWEKRSYTAPEYALKVPLMPMPPDYREGIVLQDGVPVTRDLIETYKLFITLVNAAVKDLPDNTHKAVH